jgi:hypothetical protein
MIRLFTLLAGILALTACNIERMDHDPAGMGMGCEEDVTATSAIDDSPTVCAAFCNHLFSCGNIAPDGYEGCIGQCHAKFSVAPAKTRAGCECVTQAACPASGVYACPGAPIPTASSAGSSTGSTGSSADAGSTGVPRKSGVYACTKNIDCAWSEDCVAGACEVRCKASCECHASESCVANYCTAAAPAPKVCATDCECPSGGTCVAGTCK